MKKKLAALLCGIVCVCLLATPVYADDGDPAITITDDGISGSEVIVAGTVPVSTSAENIEGVPFITKVYELPQGADMTGYTASFEQDGYLFAKHDVSQQVQEGQTDSKAVSQTETVESESGKVTDIVSEAAPVVLYSEGGYTGQLALDIVAIVVEENGATSYSYRVEDVREYEHFDRNDAAYIPKTVLKNGVTLQLENIEWVVMGQHPVDGRMVPNLFKAIATYAGTATGSRASGYTAILTYTGEVTKTTPGLCVYTVVFRGEPLAVIDANPDVSEPAAGGSESKKGGGVSLFILVATILLAAGCLAVAGARIVRRIREGGGDDDAGDFGGYEGFAGEEPAQAEPDPEDTRQFERQFPQEPQTYPMDEYNIDDLFNDEEFFNE